MRKIVQTGAIAVVFLVLSMAGVSAQQYSPNLVTRDLAGRVHNEWRWNAFWDELNHGPRVRHRVCYFFITSVGTHDRYIWIGLTFPNWLGVASCEADWCQQYGHYDPRILGNQVVWLGHDSFDFSLTSSRSNAEPVDQKGGGHWWENRAPFNTIGFANLELQQLRPCTRFQALATLLQSIPPTRLRQAYETRETELGVPGEVEKLAQQLAAEVPIRLRRGGEPGRDPAQEDLVDVQD